MAFSAQSFRWTNIRFIKRSYIKIRVPKKKTPSRSCFSFLLSAPLKNTWNQWLIYYRKRFIGLQLFHISIHTKLRPHSYELHLMAMPHVVYTTITSPFKDLWKFNRQAEKYTLYQPHQVNIVNNIWMIFLISWLSILTCQYVLVI